VTPLTAQFDNLGGTGSLTVQAPSACAWTAAVTSSDPWIAITSEPSGSGNGVVTFAVTANAETTGRTSTITVGSQSVAVAQSGNGEPTCSFEVDPTAIAFGSSASPGTVQVTAPAGCRWTSTSETEWIFITSGQSGSGSGSVQCAVPANMSSSARTGTFTVAGHVVTVVQGATGPMCTYTMSLTSATYEATGGSGTISVTAPAACGWAAVSQSPRWITLDSGGAQGGSGTVHYSVAANPGPPRMGIITIAGQPFTISQASALAEFTTSGEAARPGAEGRLSGAR